MFCVLCGCRDTRLEVHHVLGPGRTRNGATLFLCRRCHVRQHKLGSDFQAWGKKGGHARAERRIKKPEFRKGRIIWL